MISYYIEVNLICIIILMLFHFQLNNRKTLSSDQRALNLLIGVSILFCVSDMAAGICRGMTFPGARIIIESSNLIYFEALAMISFLWSIYVRARLNKTYSRKRLIISSLPLIVFTLIDITNPFTHILFRINEANLYERNFGVYLHWFVVWTYFLVPSIQVLRIYIKEKSKIRRHELVPMLCFTIAPIIASIIQMIFYGISSTQAGVTISVAMICITYQDTQILTDALTGINNRRGFDYHLSGSIQRGINAEYSLIMIDVDNFKQINDQYGHNTGDVVLQSIAEALRRACQVTSKRPFLCRFGGDEFIIAGINCSDEDIVKLQSAIDSEISSNNNKMKLPCSVSVSMGVSQGKCADEGQLKELIEEADKEMYIVKSKKHRIA